MLGLMLAAVCDTVVAPPPEMDVVRVHEWGVVWFGQTRTVATADPGATWELAAVPDVPPDYQVEAPVVYIHGPAFNGSLEVTPRVGSFTVNYPGASDLTETSMIWRFEAVPGSGGQSLSAPGEIADDWPVDLWREVPASLLRFDRGAEERFIYYETEIPVHVFPPAGEIAEQGGVETGLLVRRGEGRLWYMEVDPSGLPDALMDGEFAPLSRDTAVEHLCGWAGGELKTIEIVGLWESWNEHLSEGDWQGDTMLLFPLPPARVDEISSLSLETDRGYPVEYHRLFVGMVPLDLL